MSTKEEICSTLSRARTRIADPKDWCHGYGAEDGPMCLVHAISIESRKVKENYIDLRQDTIRAVMDSCDLPYRGMTESYSIGIALGMCNDDTTHEVVLSWIDRALDYVQKEYWE